MLHKPNINDFIIMSQTKPLTPRVTTTILAADLNQFYSFNLTQRTEADTDCC